VSLEFDARYYEWGSDTSRVTYDFVGEDLIAKALTVPVAKGRYEVSDEFERHEPTTKEANKAEMATPRKPSD
jgi:hypothetical protein